MYADGGILLNHAAGRIGATAVQFANVDPKDIASPEVKGDATSIAADCPTRLRHRQELYGGRELLEFGTDGCGS
jgi:hypothetical protein